MDRTYLENETETLAELTAMLGSLPVAARVVPGMLNHPAALHPNGPYDAELEMTVGDLPVLLLIEVKKSLYPRDVRQLAWRLRGGAAGRSTSAGRIILPFVAAQSISDGARQVLMAEEVGYYDAGGSLYLPVSSAYVFIDRPPPKAARKAIGAVFSGKRSRVVHAILVSSQPAFGVSDIAEIADVSPATASETLTMLERLEWVASSGAGPSKMRFLKDPSGMLDAWRKEIEAKVRRLEKQRYYISGANVDSIRERLASTCDELEADYALTSEIAAQEYARHLTSISRVTCRFEPDAPVEKVLERLGAKRVSEGANLEVLELATGGEFIGKRKIEGVWYASPVQVYLDLIRSEGRARDAATHLRQEVLRF